jgi:glycosyltransferase involved in cell wall biosynthesis
MKICIDIRPISKKNPTGIGIFTLTLLNALTTQDTSDFKYLLYFKKNFFDFKKRKPKIENENFEYFITPNLNQLPEADIYISSSYDFQFPQGKKSILIIHDLIPFVMPKFSSKNAFDILKKLLSPLLEKVTKVVCISNSTYRDLIKFLPIARTKAKIIYPALTPIFKKIENKKLINKRLKKIGIEGEYILFVSSIEPRKNLINLIKAFEILSPKIPQLKLVIAGKKLNYYDKINNYIKGKNIKKKIKFLGYVKNQDLVYLYNGSKIFVLPSFYEGFGLPILEAFACGVPVITSNTSSMREIAEGYAEIIEPDSIEQIAQSIVKVIEDKQYQGNLVKKGFERKEEFSLRKMGKEYLKLFREI